MPRRRALSAPPPLDPQSVQTFGRKKTAVAVSYCKKGRGLIKINGCPIELVEPEALRYKVFESILLLGRERFANMDIRIRVKGGGYTSQIYGELPTQCSAALRGARASRLCRGGPAGSCWPCREEFTASGGRSKHRHNRQASPDAHPLHGQTLAGPGSHPLARTPSARP